MQLVSIILVFIFGTLVGSYINVISLRYGTGLSSGNGRSKCFTCNTTLAWYDLIPVVSYFFLSGKCRTCRTNISTQYVIVEVLTGIMFVLISFREYFSTPIYSVLPNSFTYSVIFFAYYAFVFGLLLVISIYDIRHKVIPDKLVYIFAGVAVLKLVASYFITGLSFITPNYLDFAAPFVLFAPLALLWFASNGRWIGFGDAKLVFGIGALLGFISGISAVVLAFWIGAVWSIGLLLYSKFESRKGGVSLKTEVPFAPFLILAAFIVYMTRIDVLNLSSILNSLY